ncbi:BrnT family toxin [Actinoallomurus rhizosphaericola]|uniref:hypothetical protein n=1 Tax=Actinoallomurus rhizosphaericola TaxID=2952536 RepID=UPI002091925B|nr:hypothetical protein [Actinoallomurus rhizosphaericola]MCO5992830.1 hypothetical protein [Actinoallomurus rhizosphaericola]
MLVIETIEWDDGNLDHALRRVTRDAVEQVFVNGPMIRRNRRGRAADYLALGVTDGGRKLAVPFAYDAGGRSARPVTAWEV